MLVNDFFVTDAKESPGKIYRVQDGVESVYYMRPPGRPHSNIYSLAFSPRGRTFFVNANEKAIYRMIRFLRFTFVATVHTHSTYVRGIAFDSSGNLYFSEASGAGEDGKIYRIAPVGATATLYSDVPLSEVGGFWAGHFAFDPCDRLYVSSSNRIPAGIYRLEDRIWTEVFTDEAEAIGGMAFVACDLLCYANWRSEVYLLDVVTGARELMYSNPVHLWVSDVAFGSRRIIVDTLYEGSKSYSCDSTCWRDDGTVDDTWDFSGINDNSPDITALLIDIGVSTTPTNDDVEIWQRTRTVWSWIQEHGLNSGDPNYEEVVDYRATLGHWPSIAEFAHMFATWGGFFWGGCTCMCRAQTFATLLYRVGIPAERMAIAETKWKSTYSQHMYIVLKIGCHWYYVDPSVNIAELPSVPENVGSGTVDYEHPNKLKLIPGSPLSRPMLVR